jgi:hypothetical protein
MNRVAACCVGGTGRRWLAAALFFGLVFGTSFRAHAARSWLIGGVAPGSAVIAEPLADGRVLLCVTKRCDLWSPATGRWSPTGSVDLRSWFPPHLRLRGGEVLVMGEDDPQAATTATHIWTPATGAWTVAAPLPERGNDVQVALLADGRVIVCLRDYKIGRRHILVADDRVRAWTHLADVPEDLQRISLTATGVFAIGGMGGQGTKFWRYDLAAQRWDEIAVPGSQLSGIKGEIEWKGGLLFLLGRGDERLEGVIVAPDGTMTRYPTPFRGGNVFALTPVTPSPGGTDSPLFVREGRVVYLWTRADESPLALPPASIVGQIAAVALDDGRVFVIQNDGAVRILSVDDRPPVGPPCAGLTTYLGRVHEVGTQPNEAVSWQRDSSQYAQALGLVSVECRDEIRRGGVPDLRALIRGWIRGADPQLVLTGRVLACAARDPEWLGDVRGWLREDRLRSARAVCAAALLDWPGAETTRAKIFGDSVTKGDRGWWEVDEAISVVLDGGDSATVREALLPVLQSAKKHRASGYDRFRAAVCVDDGAMMSPERKRACADSPVRAEDEWRLHDDNRNPWAALGATVVVAGAITGAYAARGSDGGRAIATGAGVLAGMCIGLPVGAFMAIGAGGGGKRDDSSGPLIGLGIVAGGVLGGVAAYAATSSPSSRAPATAVGLAIPYLITVVWSLSK